MTVKEITLLSLEEYIKYKPIIPFIKNHWWLRTPSDDSNCACFVFRSGSIIHSGTYVYSNGIGVRPALKLELDSSDLQFWYKPEKLIGTKIEYGKYQWTILDAEFGEIYVLCDKFIATRHFDSKLNNWDTSELKQWLDTEGLKLITL